MEEINKRGKTIAAILSVRYVYIITIGQNDGNCTKEDVYKLNYFVPIK